MNVMNKDIMPPKWMPEAVRRDWGKLGASYRIEANRQYSAKKKGGVLLFLCWCIGFHYVYLEKYAVFFLYLFTLGMGGLWMVVDLFRLRGMVRGYNERLALDLMGEIIPKAEKDRLEAFKTLIYRNKVVTMIVVLLFSFVGLVTGQNVNERPAERERNKKILYFESADAGGEKYGYNLELHEGDGLRMFVLDIIGDNGITLKSLKERVKMLKCVGEVFDTRVGTYGIVLSNKYFVDVEVCMCEIGMKLNFIIIESGRRKKVRKNKKRKYKKG